MLHTMQLARVSAKTNPSSNTMFSPGLVSSADKAASNCVESKNDLGFYTVLFEMSSNAQGYFSVRNEWRSASFNQTADRPAKVICISAIKDDATERGFIFLDV